MKRLVWMSVLVAAVMAAGCSSSDSNPFTESDPGPAPGPGGVTVRMGSGFGASFQEGVILVGSGVLAAGGSTSLTVSLVIDDGSFFTDSVDVTFSSPCVAGGFATVNTPVNTTTGAATSTYAATGCSGDDALTATALVNAQLLSAVGNVNVAPAAVGSIEFDSATPENIGLQGTGGVGISETSTVIFRVVDATGGPVPGTDVTFSLNTTVGGISLSPTTATSGVDGRAQTVVQAGTVATSVRVTATVVGTQISTQSTQLTVTTGIPDQNSVSLSVAGPVPGFACGNVEAFNFDGVLVDVTARLADRFNNPIPDGTAVTFTTEGARIDGQCTTVNGECSVEWTSQNPRPGGTGILPDFVGRSTVLGTAIGEESFVDNNGNGVFDDGDVFTDIPERWLDQNENGVRDLNEPFFDFNVNGTYDLTADPGGQMLFNGLLCQHSTLCSPNSGTLGISATNVIIMSTSGANITVQSVSDADNVLPLDAPGTITFEVADLNGNAMPAGTSILAEVTTGRLVGPVRFEVGCASFPSIVSFTVDQQVGGTPTGLFFLTVETPGGTITTASVIVNN